MKDITKTTDRITQFFGLLNAGSDNWLQAGRMLCEMVDSDPNVYEKIIKRNPAVKLAALETLEHIGRHNIKPEMLLENKAALRRALELPHGEAKELFTNGALVVKQDNGGSKTVVVPLEKLTTAEVRQVFSAGGVRSPEKQVLFIREQEEKRKVIETMRYIVDGDRVTFLEDCTFTCGELMELANRLAEKAKVTLAEEIKKRQIAK